jgi:hypothetical protein
MLYGLAVEYESNGQDSCVDLFFKVACLTAFADSPSNSESRCYRLHHSALNKLVVAGQQFGRLDPRRGLRIRDEGSESWISISHCGFVWQSIDFDELVPVGEYETRTIRCSYKRPGVGVPLVVHRCPSSRSPLLPDDSFFPATLILRSANEARVANSTRGLSSSDWMLELVDPLRIESVYQHGQPYPIAKDTTAALAFRLRGKERYYLESFFSPDSNRVSEKLYTVEPYQPGKIPVVLVHGLLSDPYTWADMFNDLTNNRWFMEHCQLWIYEYPTGQAFLKSAADLRMRLRCARQTLDPQQRDPHFAQMVLVGHSMGGLISKLQVTSSGDALWRSVANRPFHEVNMPEEMRRDLAANFFFQPSADVSRVIYIGTPHKGSGYARRAVGRLGATLVSLSEEQEERHAALIESNPNVFTREVAKRIPTSVDMLDPESQLLQTMARLTLRPGVMTHSVIGDCCWTLGAGRSDGVVPVESAREPRAISERYVNEQHKKVHQDPITVREVLSILQLHAEQIAASVVPPNESPKLRAEDQADSTDVAWIPRGAK